LVFVTDNILLVDIFKAQEKIFKKIKEKELISTITEGQYLDSFTA
jgi:hypothetical protein